MLNGIFVTLVLGAVLYAAFGGTMAAVTQQGIIGGARTAVMEIALPLIGQMALWLGFMRVLRDAGAMRQIARALAPLMQRLFPDVPPEHPAMGAMIMNLAANMLGLGNAATPFGLKAMVELNRLNPHPGVASNAMVLFLAINTSGVAVLPLGAVAIRAGLGSTNAGGIIVPSLLATICSTAVAILVARWLQGHKRFAPERFVEGTAGEPTGAQETDSAQAATATDSIGAGIPEVQATDEPEPPPGSTAGRIVGAAVLLTLAVAAARHWIDASAVSGGWDTTREMLSSWLLPVLMLGIVVIGSRHRVRVYESVVKGAREGFEISVMIIPFLVAILVAVGMFRASGLLDVLISAVSPLTSALGFPAEALPMALIRPLSGSGALGVMSETMRTYGPDSFVGFLVSVLNGSTETTFYVLAVYLGSVQVRAARHAVLACLAADATGVVMATVWSRLFF